jgi:hypothetical protein
MRKLFIAIGVSLVLLVFAVFAMPMHSKGLKRKIHPAMRLSLSGDIRGQPVYCGENGSDGILAYIGRIPYCLDRDGDGYDVPVDCNDINSDIFPGAQEICDGVDNNCDGQIDEGGVCGMVTYSDSAPITEVGQSFSFTVSLAESNAGPGTLYIKARGDYSVHPGPFEPTSEHLAWDIDGLISDVAGPIAGASVLNEYSENNVEWEQSFIIDTKTLMAITSDSQLTLSIANADPYVGHVFETDYISWSLSYYTMGPIPF